MSYNVQFQYIEDSNISEKDYLLFLESYYGKRSKYKYDSRRTWYQQKDGYKILLAIDNGKILGQSCAFKDTIIIHGNETNIWWGIDVFVRPEARGYDIGKRMQKKLHNDLPNFSSAWYSPINGIVKKKCGAKELFPISFCYYPISSFISYIGNKIINKILKCNLNLKVSLPFLYSNFNSIKIRGDYSYNEIELNDNVVKFIEASSLSSSDFYIKRNKQYLIWRYINNPNLKYHIIEIKKRDKTEGVVFFTDVESESGFYTAKIMDVFKTHMSSLSDKDILYFVTKYFKNKKMKIDGLFSLTKCTYFPRLIRQTMLLSTIETEKEINNPYISYSDQDMVQMY
jgi:GNAT superfamily N-acetyltransferase